MQLQLDNNAFYHTVLWLNWEISVYKTMRIIVHIICISTYNVVTNPGETIALAKINAEKCNIYIHTFAICKIFSYTPFQVRW